MGFVIDEAHCVKKWYAYIIQPVIIKLLAIAVHVTISVQSVSTGVRAFIGGFPDQVKSKVPSRNTLMSRP